MTFALWWNAASAVQPVEEAIIPPNIIPAEAKNCRLASPPPEAGENDNKPWPVRVYPRTEAIDQNYTGCQTAWAKLPNGAWFRQASLYFERGEVTVVSMSTVGLSNRTQPYLCRFQQKQLVEGGDECKDINFVSIKSFPPGCADEVAASKQAGSPITKRCRSYR